ncbi:hypothetical protein D3C73_1041030 [compost metagenome]
MQTYDPILAVMLQNPAYPAVHIIFFHKSIGCIFALAVAMAPLVYEQHIKALSLKHIDILCRDMKRYCIAVNNNRPALGIGM